RADGIAVTGGRVGRCLFLHGSPCWKQSRASFVYSGTPPQRTQGQTNKMDLKYICLLGETADLEME
ncbi:hypothetical protein K7A41_15620, partial [Sphingobacterium sp. InxBP1]|uniref:hypothetical protein n=1 Tax=Sphingobacterium sp. InxBP1 TaxID=2870328 RepID=UPI002243074B